MLQHFWNQVERIKFYMFTSGRQICSILTWKSDSSCKTHIGNSTLNKEIFIILFKKIRLKKLIVLKDLINFDLKIGFLMPKSVLWQLETSEFRIFKDFPSCFFVNLFMRWILSAYRIVFNLQYLHKHPESRRVQPSSYRFWHEESDFQVKIEQIWRPEVKL